MGLNFNSPAGTKPAAPAVEETEIVPFDVMEDQQKLRTQMLWKIQM